MSLNIRPFLFAAALILCTQALPAQDLQFSRVIDPFPVSDTEGTAYDMPFIGGFNAPRPQFIDIDADGDPDLFLQERRGKIMFFENGGTATEHRFEWVTDQFHGIDIGRWFLFKDVDVDGDWDLLCESPFGLIRYLRNEGTAVSPQFIVAVDTLRNALGEPIAAEVTNIPDLTDIDCDGDLDLFLGMQTGTVWYYNNTGPDANGVPKFSYVTNEFQDILIIGPGARGAAPASQRHGANSLTFIDIDADGDKDLFWGDFFSPSIVYLENSGTCTVPNISITATRYPTVNPLLTGGFNVPRFGDIDGDGDSDMFVSVIGGAYSTSENTAENFYLFENVGAPNLPALLPRTQQFISCIDVGEKSVPALTDIDGDDDLDLFVANEADPSDPNRSMLYFYENQGTSASPSFRLIKKDYLGIDTGWNNAPAFADLDGDGDLDLLVGRWNGKMKYFENAGTPQAPNLRLAGDVYLNIDVGNNATPAFVDIDADGDLDLFIGSFAGSIRFYRNNGTAAAPAFQLESDQYASIDVGSYSYPRLADLDGDGDHDLLVGRDSSATDSDVVFFRNVGTPQAPEFVRDAALSIPALQWATPAPADLDGDGDLDLVIGGVSGGLMYYQNQAIGSSVDSPGPSVPPDGGNLGLRSFPNPFSATGTRIRFRVPQAGGGIRLTIINLLGEQVRAWDIAGTSPGAEQSIHWDGRDDAGAPVSPGVYFYRLHVGGEIVAAGKMLGIQ